MRKLFRAWCVVAIATLAACQGDTDSTQTSSKQSEAVVVPLKLSTDSKGLVPKTTALGTTVQLDDHFQNAVLARRNADGTITTQCQDDQAAAEAFLSGATPSHHEVK